MLASSKYPDRQVHRDLKEQLYYDVIQYFDQGKASRVTSSTIIVSLIAMIIAVISDGGTGIRGLMRGMATLPQGNQELLVIRDKVGRPQVSFG